MNKVSVYLYQAQVCTNSSIKLDMTGTDSPITLSCNAGGS